MKKELKDLTKRQLQGVVIDLLRNIDRANSILEADRIFNEDGILVDDINGFKVNQAIDYLAFGSESADESGWDLEI